MSQALLFAEAFQPTPKLISTFGQVQHISVFSITQEDQLIMSAEHLEHVQFRKMKPPSTLQPMGMHDALLLGKPCGAGGLFTYLQPYEVLSY